MSFASVRGVLGREVPYMASKRLFPLILLGILLGSVILGSIPASAGVATLPATQDSYIDAGSVTVNQGTNTRLRVRASGPVRRTLIRFDVSSIPSCATVTAADLQLTVVQKDTSSRTYNVHRLRASWKEGTGLSTTGVSWTYRDGVRRWTVPGGFVSEVPSDSTVTGTTDLAVLHWDVASDVAAWVAGTVSNHGWLIKDAAEGSGTTEFLFGSRQNGTPAYRPKLVVTFNECLPGDTTAPVGSLTINGNGAYANSTAATLTLSATDGVGVTAYYVGASATLPVPTLWVTVASTPSFSANVGYTLASGDGTKTVYAWYRDAAGNVSAAASDTIVLDQTAPSNGTVTATAGNGQVALGWAGFSDAGSGLSTTPYKLVSSVGSAPASCSSGTVLLSGSSNTSFTHTGLTNGTTYGYRVCATDKAGNMSTGAMASATPQAADTTAPADDSRYGINTHWAMASADRRRDLVEAGISWARVDFNWIDIQPTGPGSYDWAITDAIVDGARESGISLFATLAYTPQWATDGEARAGVPRDARDWASFAYAVADRYKDTLAHYGIWNEPNTTFDGNADQYIDVLLVPAYDAIKAACPQCQVGGPDLNGNDSAHWQDWLGAVLARAGHKLDFVTHHNYSGSPADVRDNIDDVYDFAAARGLGSRPFWLTETGWKSTGDGGAQAGNYSEFLTQMEPRGWVAKIFFYELEDFEPDSYGILRMDGARKPAWYAYRDFIAGPPIPSPPPGCGYIPVGSGLPVDSGVTSCDGRFRLQLQGDGNLVLYQLPATPLWATHTTTGQALWMQGDGNLVLYNGGGQALWHSGTWMYPGASLAVQDDGNLVLYWEGQAIWASNTCCR